MNPFRIYRANKTGNGFATQWQLSYKPKDKYDEFMFFLVGASQNGEDANGNAKFGWKPEEGAITCKLGVNDLGEIIAVLTGLQQAAGYKGSLYHQTPGGGNKVIKFAALENG